MKKVLLKALGSYQIFAFMVGLTFLGIKMAPYYNYINQNGVKGIPFSAFVPLILLFLFNLFIMFSGLFTYHQMKLGIVFTYIGQGLQVFTIFAGKTLYLVFSGFYFSLLMPFKGLQLDSSFRFLWGAESAFFAQQQSTPEGFLIGINLIPILLIILLTIALFSKKKPVDEGNLLYNKFLEENNVNNSIYYLNGINYEFNYLGNNIIQVSINDNVLKGHEKLRNYLSENYRIVEDDITFFIMLEVKQLEKFFYTLREQSI